MDLVVFIQLSSVAKELVEVFGLYTHVQYSYKMLDLVEVLFLVFYFFQK